MAVLDVTTAMAAATAALAAADYATALNQALVAQGQMAVLPDGGAADRQAEIVWDPKKIQDFIVNVRGLLGASTGMQRTKHTYVRPTG